MRKLIFFLALLLPFISSKVDAEDKNVVKEIPIIKVKDGLGYGSTTTEKKSSICKIQRTNTSDDFGTAYLNYMDPVIIGTETKNNINGYKVKVYDTGTVDMMIIPIYE